MTSNSGTNHMLKPVTLSQILAVLGSVASPICSWEHVDITTDHVVRNKLRRGGSVRLLSQGRTTEEDVV
jgi:hypothetical protein